MVEIIKMPKLSDTMTIGILVRWIKETNDIVKSNDIIAEVETDKATMGVENFTDGVLIKKYVNEGDHVSVGGALCAIGGKNETAPVIKLPDLKPKDQLSKSGHNGKFHISLKSEGLTKKPTPTKIHKVSPLARKISLRNSLKIDGTEVTGPDSCISKRDTLNQSRIKTIFDQIDRTSIKDIRLTEKTITKSSMRNAIATTLVRSKNESPHFYLEIEVNADRLLEIRSSINLSTESTLQSLNGNKITINDFIIKACSIAIYEFPEINSSWLKDNIKQYGEINIAFGIAIDSGLVAPVIRNTELKTLRIISNEAKVLIDRARRNQLTLKEMSGSTFTVTNLGMYGIRSFFGIINPPNAAILSVGSIHLKPIINGSGDITKGNIMCLAMSADHRIVDGNVGASFLKKIKKIIENPVLVLM